jgi:hypothetical protein
MIVEVVAAAVVPAGQCAEIGSAPVEGAGNDQRLKGRDEIVIEGDREVRQDKRHRSKLELFLPGMPVLCREWSGMTRCAIIGQRLSSGDRLSICAGDERQ